MVACDNVYWECGKCLNEQHQKKYECTTGCDPFVNRSAAKKICSACDDASNKNAEIQVQPIIANNVERHTNYYHTAKHNKRNKSYSPHIVFAKMHDDRVEQIEDQDSADKPIAFCTNESRVQKDLSSEKINNDSAKIASYAGLDYI